MKVTFQGPVGTLEGLLDEPEDGEPRGLAICCHPHPRHKGTMNNTLVYRTARALRGAGFVTLRFNFRGTEGSEGEHDGNGAEEEDARRAIDYLIERYGDLPVWAAGFSFGSRTVAGLALSEPRIRRLLLLAFPISVYPLEFLADVKQPVFCVFGSEDEFGTASEFARQFPALSQKVDVEEIQGADHFFRGKTPLVEEAFASYALEHAPRSEPLPMAPPKKSDDKNRKKKPKKAPAIRRVMMPRDTNAFGTIFGGVILAEIDLAAAVEAHKAHSGSVVTVAMDEIVFRAPVYVGDLVSFYTETERIGRTSVTVRVYVWAERRFSDGADVFVTEAQVTMVAVDPEGKTVPVGKGIRSKRSQD